MSAVFVAVTQDSKFTEDVQVFIAVTKSKMMELVAAKLRSYVNEQAGYGYTPAIQLKARAENDQWTDEQFVTNYDRLSRGWEDRVHAIFMRNVEVTE